MPDESSSAANLHPSRRAFFAQMVGDPGRVSLEGLALGHLAVEQAQRVALQAELAVAVQLRLQRPVVLPQLLEVSRAAFAVADRVQLEPQLAEADLSQPPRRQLDDLCI